MTEFKNAIGMFRFAFVEKRIWMVYERRKSVLLLHKVTYSMANDYKQREIGVKKPLKPYSNPGVVSSATAMEYGKLPPQAVEVEELVLGALMLEKNAVNTAIEILQADMFYKEAHGKIFKAIYDLFNGSEPIDIITVTNKLRSSGHLELVGGPYYITQLTSKVTSAAIM